MYITKGKITQKFLTLTFKKTLKFKKAGYPGAICTFSGIVRDDKDKSGKKINYIEYKCYGSMAKTKMKEIYSAVKKKYAPDYLVMVHGTGKIKAGETSLFILVASQHSKQGLNAVKEIVKLIKTTVPIWKKEVFADGSYRWVE
ncbi:MAG: hypothetical protein A3H98_03175 [Bacteroidetes bacterium RIFCSPLOWO2_02_FULL_36_8]|nr:MAG: hypothetical protein A3H98_03175 [Bacteroidetes bacterium RIFCSPLOWO2_02_FULL_36_8]OFY70355.1 MAG: hypothetical protein A3G23_09505 [Bacteroidetes bacterium RIFCSPLOWO2_12_FULL_37_12]